MDDTTRSRLQARGLPTTCPVVTGPSGEVVYQNKYYPWKLPPVEQTPTFSRKHGLGIGFEKWTQFQLVEFLDDYLDCKDILTLSCTTKEWQFIASSEKYDIAPPSPWPKHTKCRAAHLPLFPVVCSCFEPNCHECPCMRHGRCRLLSTKKEAS